MLAQLSLVERKEMECRNRWSSLAAGPSASCIIKICSSSPRLTYRAPAQRTNPTSLANVVFMRSWFFLLFKKAARTHSSPKDMPHVSFRHLFMSGISLLSIIAFVVDCAVQLDRKLEIWRQNACISQCWETTPCGLSPCDCHSLKSLSASTELSSWVGEWAPAANKLFQPACTSFQPLYILQIMCRWACVL